MALGDNQSVVGVVGSIQQKNAAAAHDRQISEMTVGLRTSRAINPAQGLMLDEGPEPDMATFSRPGIVALESAQALDTDKTIRDNDSAGLALADATELITGQPGQAANAQANMTPQQLLALMEGR